MKFLRSAVLLLALLGLVACFDEQQDQPASADRITAEPLASANASAPPPPEPQIAFAFQRTSVNETASRPTLCLHFTEALDPAADYEPFVAIDRRVALAAQGQSLCIEGLSYGEEAQLTLRAGLPSADGDRLQADEVVNLTFADRPAVVRFAGNGIILPREDARGLGIQTVNVDQVDVRITRVSDRGLAFRTITEGFTGAEGRYEWTPYDEQPGEFASAVFEGTLETAGERNAMTTTLMPLRESLGDLEAGAYYVEIRDASAEERGERQPARAGRWIVVTDLAATAYRGASGLDVTVRSLSSASPEARVEVSLIAQSNEVLSTQTTDRSGRVSFAAPLLRGEIGDRPKLIALKGPRGDFAFLDLDRAPLDLSSQPVGGAQPRDGYDAYVYLDRGIYRPGETLHAVALVRDETGLAAQSRPGALVLYRPNGLEQTRAAFETLEDAGSVVREMNLPAAASRGQWRLALELEGSGEAGDVRFSVEDFVPQRLALTLDADTEDPLAAGEERMIDARLRFLYGAPGAGLEVNGTARIERDPAPFPKYRGYRFGLHDRGYLAQVIDLPTVITDAEGAAALPLNLGQAGLQALEPLRARVVVRAEEPGGRAIADDIRLPYRPRNLYVGLKPGFEGTAKRQEPISFELVALSRMGGLTGADLSYRLVRHDYDYDWYQDASGVWQWRRSERVVRIAEGITTTETEMATNLELQPLPWGDYELVVSYDGEDLASTSFWVGYGGRSAGGTPAPDSVRILTPNEPGIVGETITLAVEAPYAGKAEVAVATSSILTLQHIELFEGGAEITVPVTDEWGAGAYVLVSVYTEQEPGISPVPRRAVGAAYVPVDTGSRRFDVSLLAPDLVRPGETIALTLEATDGPTDEAAFATIAAVDEGILLLTGYATPDPAAHFYAKRRLGVSLYDDYGRLLDAETGEMGALRSGGDSIGAAGLSVVPTKSVALFQGPVALDGNGQSTVELELPDFNGELRLMAVVWSESAVGSSGEPLTIRDPVPAELILPRFLAPGDEALATLTVDNVEGAAGAYRYEVFGGEEGLIDAALSGNVQLSQGERQDIEIPLRATAEGVTSLSLRVTGPNGFAAQRSYPIQVRGSFLPEVVSSRQALSPGEAYAPGADVFADFVPGSADLFLTASNSPIDGLTLSRSLSLYNYACTEQLVSQATALLLQNERSLEETSRLSRTVEALLERQGPDGAFGLWRVGDRLASPWLGAYTVDFLSRAQELGLPVPSDALDRAYRALQPISQGEPRRAYGYDSRVAPPAFTADNFERLRARSSAYALYVLAKAGRVDRSHLRYVHDAQLGTIESPLARGQVAAALSFIGDNGRAANAFTQAFYVQGYDNPGDWYQSPGRDMAGLIELLAETGRREEAGSVWYRADADFPSPESLMTQEKAFLIRAANAFDEGQEPAAMVRDGSRYEAILLTDSDDLEQPLTNETDREIFLTATLRGTPRQAPPPSERGLAIRKQAFSTAGDLLDLETVAQGDRFLIRLELQPGDVQRAQYVVSDLLPAGFEIEAVIGAGDGAPYGAYRFLGELSRTDIAEARDDRFMASVISRGIEPLRFAYLVRAVTPGSFTLPGAVAEDMYKPEAFARSESRRVTITP